MQAKRFWWSVCIWCLTGLGIFICLVIAAGIGMPWILSTDVGREWALRRMNQRIPGEIQIDRLSLGWLSPNQASGIRLLDPNGELIANCDHLSINLGLLELLQGQPLNEARLTGGSLVLELDRHGTTTLEQALGLGPDMRCRSPRRDRLELASTLDHLELEWTHQRGLGRPSKGFLVSSALCRQGEMQGSWRIQAHTEEGTLTSWEVEVDQVPSEIPDTISSLFASGLRGTLKLLLGNFVSVRSQGKLSNELEGELQIQSPHLNAKWQITGVQEAPIARLQEAASLQIDRMALQNFLRARWRGSQAVVKSDWRLGIEEASWDQEVGPRLRLAQDVKLEAVLGSHPLVVESGQVLLERESEIWAARSDWAGSADQRPWSIQGDLQLAPLKGALKAKGLPVWLLHLHPEPKLVQRLLGGDAINLEATLGPQLPHPWSAQLTLAGNNQTAFGLPLTLVASGTLRDQELSFELEGSAPRLELRTAGVWRFADAVDLQSSAGLIRWNAATVQGLGFRGFPGLGRQMVPLQLKMDPLLIDLCRGGLPTLRARLEGSAFELEDSKTPIQIANLEGRVALHPSDERASLQITADLHSLGQPKTTFAVSGTARDLGGSPNFEGRLDCPAFPLSLIETLAPQWEGLTGLLGPSLSVQADVSSEQGGSRGRFDLQASAGSLQLALPFAWAQEVTLLPERSASLYWKIAPNQWQAISHWLPPLADLDLDQPFNLQAELSKLDWKRGEHVLPALAGVVRLSPVLLRTMDRSEALALRNWQVTLTDDPGVSTRAKLSGQVDLGELSGQIAGESSWQRQRAWPTFTLELQGVNLPVETLRLLDRRGGAELAALLGPELSTRLRLGQGEDPAKSWGLWLDSSFLRIAAEGWVSREGSMGLASPLLAAWTSHPLRNEEDLGDFTLMLNSLLPNQTVAASIASAGTRFSWREPSAGSLVIQEATVDPGRLEVRSSDLLSGMNQFLQNGGSSTAQLWISPMYLSVNTGRLELKRFDVQINEKTPVALWGSIDLNDGRLAMTAGFPEQALMNFLSSPLGTRGLFTVNLGGTLDNPQVDWKGAAARLALTSASKLNLGALVFGSVIERAFSRGVPEPTTQPLPWVDPSRPTPRDAILRRLDAELSQQLPRAAAVTP